MLSLICKLKSCQQLICKVSRSNYRTTQLPGSARAIRLESKNCVHTKIEVNQVKQEVNREV